MGRPWPSAPERLEEPSPALKVVVCGDVDVMIPEGEREGGPTFGTALRTMGARSDHRPAPLFNVGIRFSSGYERRMDEAKLLEKLARIEALFAGATTDGERVAAGEAKRRIQMRLEAVAKLDRPVEYKFTLADGWSRKVFIALLRRYELKPYRYRGQRRTTVMVKVSKGFVDETLWPEFQQINATLMSYLEEITDASSPRSSTRTARTRPR